MSISHSDLTPGFAGEVSGVDITQPLTGAEAAETRGRIPLWRAGLPRPKFTDEQQQGVQPETSGPLEFTVAANRRDLKDRRLSAMMADVSNLGVDHKPLPRDDRRRLFNLGNQLWHSDSSFRAIPAKYSLLSARSVVDRGGNTEFADMRASYDALDAATKAEIEDLICEHSLIYLARHPRVYRIVGRREEAIHAGEAEPGANPPGHRTEVAISVVAHRHDRRLAGARSRAFIRDLTEHATQPRFTYVHRWRQFDLVMWDNRTTMHRVRRFDETQVRDMRRTTVAGNSVTAEQLAA